jgi:hypothetical protein
MPGEVAKLLAEEATAKAAEEAAAEAAAEAARKKSSFFGRWFTWDSKSTKDSIGEIRQAFVNTFIQQINTAQRQHWSLVTSKLRQLS